jgi:RNA polymerase sigma factor (sigma-70 family)
MDEDALIQAARDNAPYAGAFMVSLYGPRLAGYCRSIASDLSDTDREHAVAVGIERAVRRFETYDETRGSLLAWLRPFVRHAAQDWRRSNAVLSGYDIADAAAAELPVPAADASAAEHSGAAEAVRSALPKLSIADQVVIGLRDYEMYSVAATAEILDIAADACRQRHHRALKRLQRLLEEDERTRHLRGDEP